MKTKRCPTCGRRERRSHPQNARYWLLLHVIAEQQKPRGQAYGVEAWHTYFKSRFLGCEEVKLPNERTAQIPRTTADLGVDEFSDYQTRVEEWANERGVFLADREEAA